MKRIFDIIFSFFLILILLIPCLIIMIYLIIVAKGKVLFLSRRVGINSKIFFMFKFRTMYEDAPNVASHLLENPDLYLLPFGNLLRKSSVDEIPQLFNIFLGDMTFIGPRPALFNQKDLMELRIRYGIDKQKPGITGWAQINGRDSISIPAKVELEKFYLQNRNFLFDIKIIILTIFKIFRLKDISH